SWRSHLWRQDAHSNLQDVPHLINSPGLAKSVRRSGDGDFQHPGINQRSSIDSMQDLSCMMFDRHQRATLAYCLATGAESRINNCRFTRLLAATSVIVAHAAVVNLGLPAVSSQVTPELFGVTYLLIGDLAVDIFFAVSGFLVAHSLFSRIDAVDYI